MDEQRQVSLGRRWLVAASCSWVNLFVFSILRAGGVLYVAIVDTFGCTYQEASWPISLASAVMAMACLPSGFLSHYFHKQTIVLCGVLICSAGVASCFFANDLILLTAGLGVVNGVGMGMVVVSLPPIITEHFGQQRAAAVGLSFAGVTTGGFIFPLLCKYLLDAFQLRKTLLIMGAIILSALIGVALLRPKSRVVEDYIVSRSYGAVVIDEALIKGKGTTSGTVQNAKNSLFRGLKEHFFKDAAFLQSPHFALISLTYTISLTAGSTFLMILPDFAMDAGVDQSRAVLLLSVYAVTDLLGRLLPGWLSYAEVASNKVFFVGSIGGLGATLVICPLLIKELSVENANFHVLLILTLVFGFLTGCQMPLTPVVLAQHFGQKNISIAYGLCNVLYGAVSFSRPFLVGYIKDSTSKYDGLFYLLGSLALICSFCWLVEILIVNCNASSKNESSCITENSHAS